MIDVGDNVVAYGPVVFSVVADDDADGDGDCDVVV